MKINSVVRQRLVFPPPRAAAGDRVDLFCPLMASGGQLLDVPVLRVPKHCFYVAKLIEADYYDY